MHDIYLVVMADRKHGKFFRYDDRAQSLEVLQEIEDEVPRPVKGASWAGLADARIARHIEDHFREHFKNVLHALEHHLSKPELDEAVVILAGPKEDVHAMEELMASPVKQRVVGAIHPDHYAGIKELEAQVLEAISRVQEARVASLVNEIEDQRQPNGLGVVGREPVFEALNLKSVQTVMLNLAKSYPGRLCPIDGSLSTSLERCPICGNAMEAIPDLRDAIRKHASAQNATLLELPGGYSLPDEYEDIAALKRFAH